MQTVLPGLGQPPRSVEDVYIDVATKWRNEFQRLPPNTAPTRLIDDLALTGLMLGWEYGSNFSESTWTEAFKCIELSKNQPVPWIERLPWALPAPETFDDLNSLAIEQLIEKLNHPRSSLRCWALEIAWVVRSNFLLQSEDARYRLFENVANTLAAVDQSWGLAAEIFDSEADLWAAARAWQPPPNFAEQYSERLSTLGDVGLRATQAHFWYQESRCWRLAFEIEMGIRLSKTK